MVLEAEVGRGCGRSGLRRVGVRGSERSRPPKLRSEVKRRSGARLILLEAHELPEGRLVMDWQR